MTTYSVAEAKNTLPRLLDRALEGEQVIITRHGKPVAEIRAMAADRPLPTREQRRVAMERLREMRESLPPATETSVELLRTVYGDKPW